MSKVFLIYLILPLPMKAIKLQSDYNKLDMDTPSVAEEHVTMRPRRHR